MSRKVVERPAQRGLPGRFEGLALLLVVVALATLGFKSFLHVHVVLDGARVEVTAGTTVADLVASRVSSSRSGDLLALDGSVLRKGGGARPSAWSHGIRVASDTALTGGERIVTRQGQDVTEEVVRSRRMIPIPVQVTGTGSIVRLGSTGAAGVVVVRAGAVSGQVVATESVSPPTPMTVVRTTPAPAPGGRKLIALTFDDGPWPESTERILRVLREQGVHATFFMVGNRVSKQPALARKVLAEGHVLGNHTLSHRALKGAGVKVVRGQVRKGAERITKATGVKPRWFRPPGGGLDSVVLDEARRVNEQLVLWSVDPRDWSRPGWKKIAARVVNATKPGDVILLHDGGGDRGQTYAALPRIIRRLRAKGFTFVTLDELAASGVKPAKR